MDRGTLCGKTMCLARQVRVHWVMRCTSTTMSAGLLKSSGRIGQARWWRSLSLEDWVLGRVAFGCLITMDFLCQEMRDACWDRVGGLGAWKVNCHSKRKPFSHRGRAVSERERKYKKKECERQAEVSEEDLRVSSFEARFPSFECESACLSPSIFVLCVQSEGWKEG